jgi:hypothetical protein
LSEKQKEVLRDLLRQTGPVPLDRQDGMSSGRSQAAQDAELMIHGHPAYANDPFAGLRRLARSME